MKLRVFLLDDSRPILDSLQEMLAASGQCEIVGRASSEKEAIDWSYQHDAGFDVAILDLMLSEGSGFPVLAHLAKYQPGKLVVLSEFATPSLVERCKALGAAAAFPKSESDACVRYVLALAQQHAEQAP